MEEIQHLQRRLDERVLERAETDPQWKQQFIEDPETAVGDIPEAQRLLEMLESGQLPEELPESTMPTPAPEEYRQLQRVLTEKILDRAASDPTWKQQLLDNPEAAMREANFPESLRLDEILQEEVEVRGHGPLPDYTAPVSGDMAPPSPGGGGGWGTGCPPLWWTYYSYHCSDRFRKEHFAAVDEREILSRLVDIPIESWNYKGQDPSIRHIGPMAQDFAAAFDVGEDDKHIHMVDANGVTMAAIQALYQMIREKDAQIDALRVEVDALKQLNSSGSVPRAVGRRGRKLQLANQR